VAAPTIAPTAVCGEEAPDAWFRVVSATPTFSCYGPTTEAEGTCFTTLNGSCITDGPGNYGNNERCTIEVLRSGYLTVQGSFTVEENYDYFTINASSTRLDTAAALENIAIFEGTTISWLSDNSGIEDGWMLCGSVRTPFAQMRQRTCAARCTLFFNAHSAVH
jgi:hypothetical protein